MMENKNNPRMFWFVVASISYVGWVTYGGFFHSSEIINLDLKDWGNLLAGVFSPLAFFWLLYAALAQRAELELQRNELKENNETQREQQLQMKRQADALDAQINRLNGQADAQYQPILVLQTSSSISGANIIRLHIKNLGADVIEVLASNNYPIVNVLGHSAGDIPFPRGGALSYWPKGILVCLDIPANNEIAYDCEFSFEFKRLDNAKCQYKYMYKNAEQKIVLMSKIEVE